jgi:hypothetical protein
MCAAVRELIELGRAEAVKRGVSAQTEPAEALPGIPGDRVELQPVILNLILNAVEAMSEVSEGLRESNWWTVSEPQIVTRRAPAGSYSPAGQGRSRHLPWRPLPDRNLVTVGQVDLRIEELRYLWRAVALARKRDSHRPS